MTLEALAKVKVEDERVRLIMGGCLGNKGGGNYLFLDDKEYFLI